jgi:nitroimidazol reductase NimA-like FMN-containing flavoprotein (pyridoxamine 5'-phosphate oxidase superfamily)
MGDPGTEALAGETYGVTRENQPSRHPERARYDRPTVHDILDSGLVAHVAFIADERPRVLPMLYVRVGERIYLHGSTGAHITRMAARRRSLPVAVEVTLVSELVLARSTFNHSANYRSVVVHGDALAVSDESRKNEVLAAMVNKLIPGRGADARPPTSDELRQTAVLELALDNVSAKVRTGDPVDPPEELASPCWAGLRPIVAVWGAPKPAADLADGVEVPGYLGAGGVVHLPL